MSADNGIIINKGISVDGDRKGITRKQFIDLLMLGTGVALAGCVPASIASTGESGKTQTPGRITKNTPIPDFSPTLGIEKTVNPSATATPTATKEQVISGVCEASVEQMNLQGDITQRLPAPNEWSESEKANIVDALGNPIYPDVLSISQGAADAGLEVDTVAIAENVGGYIVGLKNDRGSYVWMQDNEDRPAGRMDNNGQIVEGQWDVITSPPIGSQTVWMQKEDGGVCGYIVSEKGGVVVAKYEPVTKSWSVDENAVASIPETPMPVIDVPFDKSRPETIKASDGKEYQGYYMSDSYGTRLSDNVNSIILVKDEEVWREPEEKLFPDQYPAKYYETKEGHSDGLTIPITLAIGKNANKVKEFKYSEAHMTQLGADGVAPIWLHSAWLRYADIMNHPDVSYEQYLELLKEGKGNLEILDTTRKKQVLVDPRQGFSLVMTGDKDNEMPIRYYDAWGFNFSVNERGKFLFASNAINHYINAFPVDYGYTDEVKNCIFLYGVFGGICYISSIPDRCMIGRVEYMCADDIKPINDQIMGAEKLYNDGYNFVHGKSDDPLFTLR